MKAAHDGLSKSWAVERSHLPFYSGGKVEISHDNSQLVTLFDDQIKLINFNSGEIANLNLSNGVIPEVILSYCMHPNGKEIVIATKNNTLKHYNIENMKLLRTIRGHNMPVLCMTYDSTGTLVATGSADRMVRIWDIEKGYCTHSFRGHTDIIHSVMFHPNMNLNLLISTSDDHSIKLWDLITSECITTFSQHLSVPKALAISPDGHMLISSGMDKVLNFYSLRNKTHIKLLPVMEEIHGIIALNEKHSLSMLELRRVEGHNVFVLVTAGEQGALKLYKVEMLGNDHSSFKCEYFGQVQVSLPATVSENDETRHMRTLQGVQYLPKTHSITAITGDQNFYNFSLNSSKVTPLTKGKQFVGFNDDILDIIWIPKAAPAAAVTAPTAEGEEGVTVPPVETTAVADKNFELALITNSSQIKIFDSNFAVEIMDGHEDIVLAGDVTPDGKYLVTSSKDKTVRVWDLQTKTQIGLGKGHTDSVGAVAVSQRVSTYISKQSFIVSGGMDKVLKRWVFNPAAMSTEQPSFPCSHSIRAHDKDVNTIAVAPNDAIIATGSQDKTIKLWKSADLSAVATLKGHKRGIWKVSFSPVDKCLVSSSGDRTLKLWSMTDFTCLRTFEGHTASVLTVKFINKGTQLISASADGLIRLWTIRSGECENTFDKHTDRIWSLATCPASNQSFSDLFISGGSDSSLHLWKDVTVQEENEKLKKREEMLMIEQGLHNDIRNKRYAKALRGALALDHPGKVMHILVCILEDNEWDYINPVTYPLTSADSSSDSTSTTALGQPIVDRLDAYISHLQSEEVEKLVSYCKDWNMNTKSCFIGQAILYTVLKLQQLTELMEKKSFIENLESLIAYSEKHQERLNKLHQSSYISEYMTSLMTLLPLEETKKPAIKNRNNHTGNQIGDDEDDEDDAPIIFSKSVSSSTATTAATDGTLVEDELSDEDENVTKVNIIVEKNEKKRKNKDENTAAAAAVEPKPKKNKSKSKR